MNSSFLTASLGMPPKPAIAPAKTNGVTGINTHLANAMAFHKKGDHKTAKKHALKAVNLLHRMSAAPGVIAPVAPAAPAAA